jgi:predicted nucleic acid-binding protein
MAVVVFDTDVLIGYLGREDVHHQDSVTRVEGARGADTRRLLSAVNYAELLVGPLRAAGTAGAEIVDVMLERLAIETIPVDRDIARRAAAIRGRGQLKLPDAFAVATADRVEADGFEDVRVESFDERVLRACASRSSAT